MDAIKLLRWFIQLIEQFGVFGDTEFEFLEFDQRPNFYAGIFTLRDKTQE